MSYKVIDRSSYYRKGVFRHFSEDCKCSLSMTARVDVTDLVAWSRRTGSKFYINFLYVLAKVMNSRACGAQPAGRPHSSDSPDPRRRSRRYRGRCC